MTTTIDLEYSQLLMQVRPKAIETEAENEYYLAEASKFTIYLKQVDPKFSMETAKQSVDRFFPRSVRGNLRQDEFGSRPFI